MVTRVILYVFILLLVGCGFNVEVDNSPVGDSGQSEVLVVVPNFLITASPAGGVYETNPEVLITSAGFEKVKYCLSFSSQCCVPNTNYSGSNILISTHASASSYDEGEFCLSFQGYGSNFKTAIQEYQYVVDNSAPSISAVIFPMIGTNETRYMQTNEAHLFLRSTSQNFGEVLHYQTNLNLGAINPAIYANCQDIYNNHPFATFGMYSTNGDQETDASLYPYVDTQTSVATGISWYGENNLVSIMRYNDPMLGDQFSCVKNKMILRDFPLFFNSLNSNYSTPVNGNQVLEFQGSITPFGGFNGLNVSTATANQAPYKLETNFIDIVN